MEVARDNANYHEISGIKGVQVHWVSPSVQVNPNQCARFVFLSHAIDETDSPALLLSLVTRESHMPPSCETRYALPDLRFQFCRYFLGISPQLSRRRRRLRLRSWFLDMDSHLLGLGLSPPLIVTEMFKLKTAPSVRPRWPQCPPNCWDQRGETKKNNASWRCIPTGPGPCCYRSIS